MSDEHPRWIDVAFGAEAVVVGGLALGWGWMRSWAVLLVIVGAILLLRGSQRS